MRKEQLIFIDFEFTMPDHHKETDPFFPEIIEAGVVVVRDQTILKKFSSYVKPATFPRLTEKCKHFLGITQGQVDQGISFKQLVHYLTQFPKEVSHLKENVGR